MSANKPAPSRAVKSAWIPLAAFFAFAAPGAYAQQSTSAPHPVYRAYQRSVAPRPVVRPMISRPVQTRPMSYPQPVPGRRAFIRPLSRMSASKTYVTPKLIAPHPFTFYDYVQPASAPAFLLNPAEQRAAWRGIGPRGSANWFGGTFVNDYGYWQPSANYQMLPLGFGLWPACDSASIPGRFWTIGPCAGVGDYQSATPAYRNQYLMGTPPPPYYQPILQIIEQQPEAPPPPSAKQPSAPETKPNMLICLTDGKQLEVSDWWVTGGRFFFIPVNGKTQSVDLDALDLQKTIEADEKRGRTFILNFTPPSDRPLPQVPSSQ